MITSETLQSLGWRSFFQEQLRDGDKCVPKRVVSVHRSHVELIGEAGHSTLELAARGAEMRLAVGDWVLLDSDEQRIREHLTPFGAFKRRAAGTSGDVQVIAANVDTLFIVTSANRDFNVARLERYLAIAHDAGAFPVVIITKTDLADGGGAVVNEFLSAARALSPGLLVEALDGRDEEQVAVLRSWCGPGQTVALLGSSGVGKTTLTNTLAGIEQATAAVRGDDQRGRHTTTQRTMHALQDGGWLIDTPGMRELQLVDVADALDDVFEDVTALARLCKFKDCLHESEPGCAVQAAIDDDRLEAARLRRYRKLQAEDRRNSESLAARRSRDKALGKYYKSVQTGRRDQKANRK